MNPLFLLTLPIFLACLTALLGKTVCRFPVFSGTLLASCFWGSVIFLFPAARSATPFLFSQSWAPALGLDVSLRMTAFSAWFGILVFVIGGCVLLYASSYFSKSAGLPFLLICLLLFTASMLGVIWSDNLFLLFLFWEGTSLLSFLLVGFHHTIESTRAKASQALLVTFAGGAALLAGFICLASDYGDSSISGLLSRELQTTPLTTAAVVLIILGAITKSAQFPFHFWLPNAMAGPTPVSAFLHSATMVKAGVFLLAVLAPLLSDHPLWTPLLVTSGLLTVAISISRGCRDDDLKGILASTTLAALGFLTVLAGIGSEESLKAFVIFLTAHALYKAPLFLAAGNFEKLFGTRQLSQLGGAIPSSPLAGSIVFLSIASLIGIPPFPGFLGKEYLLKALWTQSPLLTLFVAIAAAGTITVGVRALIPLLSKRPLDLQHKLPKAMLIASAVPALGSLLLIAFFPWINADILGQAATSLGAEKATSYSFWHGFTPALGIGLAALASGIAVVRFTHTQDVPTSAFEKLYETIIRGIRVLGSVTSRLIGDGALSLHLSWILVSVGLLATLSLGLGDWPELGAAATTHSWVFILVTPVLIIATLIAARTSSPLTQLVSLGFIGLVIAFLFLWFSAPDLALTQLLAETLVLFLIAGVLFRFGNSGKAPEASAPRLIISVTSGILMTLLILKSIALEWGQPASGYYIENSKKAAFGANVVNVILVDFRALDTLGEIVVLAIAALGANAALGAARKRIPLPGSSATPWLESTFPLVMALIIPTALWTFWRGHNTPGGGFIAALLVAVAVGLPLLGHAHSFTAQILRNLSKLLLTSGLSISLVSALLPLLVGKPLLAGLWWHSGDLHLGSPLLFDLGVFLTVLGFSISYLRHFHLSRLA